MEIQKKLLDQTFLSEFLITNYNYKSPFYITFIDENYDFVITNTGVSHCFICRGFIISNVENGIETIKMIKSRNKYNNSVLIINSYNDSNISLETFRKILLNEKIILFIF